MPYGRLEVQTFNDALNWPQTETESITSLTREASWGNGFRPIAIPYGLKHPVDKEWPDLARKDPPLCIMNLRLEMGDKDLGGNYRCGPCWYPNTGILTDGLRAIDIDIDDEDSVAVKNWCFDHFGVAPIRYRDNGWRLLLLYRSDSEPPKSRINNGEPAKAKQKAVEILGKGQQFMAYGHHDSGAVLRWLDDQGPHNVRRCDLPVITEDQVVELLRFAADLMGVDYEPKTYAAPTMMAFDAGEYKMTPNDVRACLDRIANPAGYDDWFNIGCAVHDASGGSQTGLQAWGDWSSDPSACGKTWKSMQLDKAGGIKAGTLVSLARETDPSFRLPSKTVTKLRTFL